MKTFKRVLLWGVGIIVVVIVLAVALTSGADIAARGQLRAIRARDMAKAYGYTSRAFQQETSFERFSALVESSDALLHHNDVSFSSREVSDSVGVLKGQLKNREGQTSPITVHLVKENGEWKVRGLDAVLGSGTGGAVGRVNGATGGAPSAPPPIITASVGGGTLADVLVSDSADTDGFVATHKAVLRARPEKIYATVQVADAQRGTLVSAELTFLSGSGGVKIRDNRIDVNGNVQKAFSFTSETGFWPAGEYRVKVTLSTRESREVVVTVR